MAFRRKQKPKKTLQEIKSQRELIKSKLDPMTFAMMMREASVNPKNDWIKTSLEKIEDQPFMISDKWINSLNKWCSEYIKRLSATDPELENGKRTAFVLKVEKVSPPNLNTNFPEWSCLFVDENDWKYYVKSKHFKEGYKNGDIVSFNATAKSSKEGITFLSRATKLQKITKDI